MNRYFSLLICTIFLFLTTMVSVSAKSGDIENSGSGASNSGKLSTLEKLRKERKEIQELKWTSSENNESGSTIQVNEIEQKRIETKLKRDINSYIIESYKAQWNKIIKDLSIKLTKTIAEPEERKLAYEKIQDSLKSRLEKTEETEGSDSKKEILQEFLRHLIQLLDKKSMKPKNNSPVAKLEIFL